MKYANINVMNIISWFIDFVLHLDVHLGEIINTYGIVTYVLLFGIIFVETGLVFVPFLPGDSLLFVAGAFAALGDLNVFALLILLIIAAVLGDSTNYWIGHFAGEKIIANPRFHIKEEYLEKTRRFFDKHGGKTIILARFVPIIRTFAPFVAGAGRMSYRRFFAYNVIGGVLWVALGILAGYFLGNIPLIKNNFSLFLIGIVVVSLIPVLVTLIKGRTKTPGQ
ncbi:MAG: DedA family protein [Dehalococcoidales bacterium]|nr:DedA family protein [Dehalococcoidales bacterium]